jgi:phosphoribosylanthranilate isomerase
MQEPLKIKVCGLRDPENIEQVCSLSPDLVGYIFYPGSKRYVGRDPDPGIFRIPDKRIKKVGVFVNEEITKVFHAIDSFNLDMVQLHGSEPATYCKTLNERRIPVIKALNPENLGNQELVSQYGTCVNYFLFDTTGEKEFGGTGRQFNWKQLDRYSYAIPFILSGGIGPGDAGTIKDLGYNMMYGMDVNSRFELAPGMKNVELLEGFIREIRK